MEVQIVKGTPEEIREFFGVDTLNPLLLATNGTQRKLPSATVEPVSSNHYKSLDRMRSSGKTWLVWEYVKDRTGSFTADGIFDEMNQNEPGCLDTKSTRGRANAGTALYHLFDTYGVLDRTEEPLVYTVKSQVREQTSSNDNGLDQDSDDLLRLVSDRGYDQIFVDAFLKLFSQDTGIPNCVSSRGVLIDICKRLVNKGYLAVAKNESGYAYYKVLKNPYNVVKTERFGKRTFGKKLA